MVTSIFEGHIEIADMLCQRKELDVNEKNIENLNALMLACNQGHLQITKKLLQCKRFHLFQKSNEGFSALMIACNT
jgi:ankyrin repeat protein